MNVNNLTVGCFDLGLWTENCLALTKKFKKVYYYRPNFSAFQEPFASVTGLFKGMEISKDFFNDLSKDKYDMVFVPDNGCTGVVNLCRKIGIPTAGVGDAEEIEIDRWGAREYQKKHLPWQISHKLKGCDALEKFIKENKGEWYVKVPNEYRAVEESFPVLDPKDAEGSIRHLRFSLGPFSEDIEFLAEEMLKGPEPGMDFITRQRGGLVFPTQVGYEEKGTGIIMRVYNKESEVPPAMMEVYNAFEPEFKRHKLDFFCSFETRMSNENGDKAGPIPFPLDWTLRHAGPGTAAIQSSLSNYPDIVAALAFDEDVTPQFPTKYAAACCMHSEEAMKTWLNVTFPKEMRPWIKFRIGCQKGDDFYAIPKFDSVGTVLGFGNSIDDAISEVKERMEKIKGKRLDKGIDRLEKIRESIKEGRGCGINF